MPNEAPPMPEVTRTLIEDLETSASAFEQLARWQNDIATQRAMDGRAARLRKAVARINAAVAHEQANAGVNEWHAGASTMLAYIVHGTGPLADLAGPAPVSTPMVPREHECPSCDLDDSVKVPPGKLLKSTPIVRPPAPVSHIDRAYFAGATPPTPVPGERATEATKAAAGGAGRIPSPPAAPIPGPGSGETCARCQGRGRRVYSSTATWHGGAGGQTVTEDVCNRCWGSGDETKPGPDLRRVQPNPGSGMGPRHEETRAGLPLSSRRGR